jgi:hypothetical protein
MGTFAKRFRKRTKIERMQGEINHLSMMNNYLTQRIQQMIRRDQIIAQNQLDERTEQCGGCV